MNDNLSMLFDEHDLGFEERADHVSEDVLLNGTAVGDYFDEIHKALISRGLVLLTGPRGCGKTHMMRYTHLICRNDNSLPLPIYVSFNRYLRLEPFLLSRSDALTVFQSWVLSRILIALFDVIKSISGASIDVGIEGADYSSLSSLIEKLERGVAPSENDTNIIEGLSIEAVINAIEIALRACHRKRAIILLDDAALTLTPEYLIEFFDIVRVLKRQNISPKASVYPGTTEYGPRFHANHEGRSINAWIPIEHKNYLDVMKQIADRRYPEGQIVPRDMSELLMFAAFGVPRAYLTMLREYKESTQQKDQQSINRIIQNYRDARILEYQSLALKMPKLYTMINTGNNVFAAMIEQLKEANLSIGNTEKQLIIGIERSEFDPLRARMFNLLVEAGLIREESEVSHGPDRVYKRYVPHVGALIAARAFSEGSRGFSAKNIVEFLQRQNAKHPIRRSLKNLVGSEILAKLSLDEPPCQSCGVERLNDNQKFCHNCGTKLLDTSTFTRCMNLDINEVPHLTEWQKTSLHGHGINKISDLLSLQDPGTHLRQIWGVGPKKADKIITRVKSYVDEFLS